MTTPADSTPGHEAPKEYTSGLTAALLRISASLDLETVLREVIESARELTARALLRHRHARRDGGAPGLRHLRVHGRGASEYGGVVRRPAAL